MNARTAAIVSARVPALCAKRIVAAFPEQTVST